MHKVINPPTVSQPASKYAHAMATASGHRWVHISGQIGIDAAGQMQQGFEAQCRTAFANIEALLTAADMGFPDLVKLGVFLTDAGDVPAYRAVRDEVFAPVGGVTCASTLLMISALVHPDLCVEIEAIAAQAT